jgi:putative nucleotidyltransferase with HDIG domain
MLAQAVKELQAYRLKTSPQNFSTLIATISKARQRYVQALARYSKLVASKPGTLSATSLLNLSDAEWKQTKRGMLESSELILTQGIPPGLPSIILQQAVSLQVKTLVPKAANTLAIQMLLSVLQPNLKEDVEQTGRQAQQAASAVAPVMIEVQQGEVIVKQGEVISQQDFLLLDYFNLSRREINWLGLIKLGGVVTAAVSVFGLVEWRFHSKSRQSDRLLVLLLTLSTPLLVTVGVSYTSLPAIGLLLGSFYGSPLGITVVGLLTALLPIGMGISWQHLVAGTVGGLLGSWMAGRMRSREELALLGGAVGLIQGAVYLLAELILNTPGSFLWYVVVREAALVSLSGLAWSIVALGLSPYLEHLFDIVTPIRLAELANPNRVLLKRLATVTPGTFQHTLFVATLAEAAAKALECNVELVRAGTLYHDIGKMRDPLAFIENQMGGCNKHDEINDPWKSAEIIKKHVSEGLVMARKHRLPTAVQAFIPEHQGTMLIAYFYHQANQRACEPEGDAVNRPVIESDFRYDGPIPQSRETGIVMLADSCEAALRTLQASAKPSLKDVCPEEALAMVNKILRSRWQDNQLVASGLKREEMSQIAEIFVQVWQQFHHKRIAYPKAVRGARDEGRGAREF